MIRINLLPYKESTLVQWGQRQFLVYVAAVVVSVLACVIINGQKEDPMVKIRALKRQREGVEQQINTVQSRTFCDRDKYKALIKKARRKYKAVERLITRRRTPKYVLREMSRILSEAWGPTLKMSFQGKDKRALYNQSWDPSAVWITKFKEKGRIASIEGGAKASDDVAEFWRRLQVSAYFANVDLQKFSKVKATKSGEEYLQFSIVAGVNY